MPPKASQKEAAKASRDLIRTLAKMQGVSPDYNQAVAMCDEAVDPPSY